MCYKFPHLQDDTLKELRIFSLVFGELEDADACSGEEVLEMLFAGLEKA